MFYRSIFTTDIHIFTSMQCQQNMSGFGLITLQDWGMWNYSDWQSFRQGRVNFCCGSPSGNSILRTDNFGGVPWSRMNGKLIDAPRYCTQGTAKDILRKHIAVKTYLWNLPRQIIFQEYSSSIDLRNEMVQIYAWKSNSGSPPKENSGLILAHMGAENQELQNLSLWSLIRYFWLSEILYEWFRPCGEKYMLRRIVIFL